MHVVDEDAHRVCSSCFGRWCFLSTSGPQCRVAETLMSQSDAFPVHCPPDEALTISRNSKDITDGEDALTRVVHYPGKTGYSTQALRNSIPSRRASASAKIPSVVLYRSHGLVSTHVFAKVEQSFISIERPVSPFNPRPPPCPTSLSS